MKPQSIYNELQRYIFIWVITVWILICFKYVSVLVLADSTELPPTRTLPIEIENVYPDRLPVYIAIDEAARESLYKLRYKAGHSKSREKLVEYSSDDSVHVVHGSRSFISNSSSFVQLENGSYYGVFLSADASDNRLYEYDNVVVT